MARSLDLNLIAMDIEKNIVFTVEDTITLEEVSEEMIKLYKDADKDSFAYRKTDNPKEASLFPGTVVGTLAAENETEVILYVTCRPKKSDVCCLIYWLLIPFP